MIIRTCQKIPYDTRALALDDIHRIKIQRRYRSKKHAKATKSGRKMRVYECRWCGKWHLTTQKPK